MKANDPIIRRSIFLSDDDSDDCTLFTEALLEITGEANLTVSNDGARLMQLLENTPPTPEIIFLDLNMPRKSGMECLREIRESDRLKRISVAIYSTSSSEQDIEDTFVAGANVYIRKPNDFNMLKKVLSDVVHINWQYIVDGLNKDSFILSL